MGDQLTVQVETDPEIMAGKEERKAAFQESIQLTFRRALGLRVEVELVRRV